MNIEQARFNMIEQQVKPWKVFDQNLLGAMSILPRESFVPEAHRAVAYADTCIPLGYGQVMLTPRELARMVQALELKGDEKLLEIGCGSGYSTALLSKLCKQVYSVDIIAEFVESCRAKMEKFGCKNVKIEEADAAESWITQAPYDAIIVTAAQTELGDSFKRSIKNSGKVVSVIDQQGQPTAALSQLDANGDWVHEYLFPMECPDLINCVRPNSFVF